MFTTDVQHNIGELRRLIRSSSPETLQTYWRDGYPDDDFPGYSDHLIQLAYIVTKALKKVGDTS